jgi:phytoene desaturase
MKAVVIGGGLGGLATALRLAARNWQVTICEAGPTFGGKMNRWSEAGYSFDTGPSLVTLPDVFAELYRSIGEQPESHVRFIRVDPHAEYRFADGSRLVCPSSTDQWREHIRSVEPRDVDGFDRLNQLGRNLYELSSRTFFRRSPASPPTLADLPALRYFPLRHGWGNYAKTVAHFLRSPALRQIYNRYPTYVGSSPWACPATLLLIPFLEREFGAWYIQGGLYKMVESLTALLQKKGATLLPNTRVTSIERNGATVSGVRLQSSERIQADVVVMNGDTATLPALLGNPAPPQMKARSLSGFVMLLGLPSRPANLPHHTVIFSADYRNEFDDLFLRRQFPTEPTVYLSAPAASDPTVAPPGGEALFAMANAPANPACTGEAAAIVRARLAAHGIDTTQSKVTQIFDPAKLEQRYLAPGGAIYGTDSHGWKNAFFRQPNRSSTIRGLYFTGGSAHPGGGTPTVLMSSKITADLIENDVR